MELVRLSLDETSLEVCLVLQLAYLGLHGLLLLLPLKGARRPVRPLGGLHVRGGVCLVRGGDSCAAILDLGCPFAGESVGLDLLAEPGVESMDSTGRQLAILRPVPGSRRAVSQTKRLPSSSGTSGDSC